MIFNKAKEMFIENCKVLERSPSTISQYDKYLTGLEKLLSCKYNRPVYVEEVKAGDLEQFIFKEYNLSEYSTSVQHSVITAFKSMYSYLARKNICENTGKMIKNIKVETAERATVSEIELRKLMQHIKASTARAVIYTLYYAGLRINEAINLKLEDVDLEKDELHVKETKTGEDRTVPINARLKKVLEDYLSDGRIDYRTDYFFSNYPKGRVSAQGINKQLRNAKAKAGINKDITAHSMRHSFASNLVQRNVDIVTLRNLLGHKSIRTTSIYCHTSLEELEEAINVL
ncbi:MAG TPA: tyrosine-type recombinase/integrase [Negativicutes bacterium]|nr:tyrosine-type recombinase/integrase [Negativicutes bacterium]